VNLTQRDLEHMEVIEGAARLSMCQAIGQAEKMRAEALSAQLAKVRERLVEQRVADGFDESGFDVGGRAKRSGLLDSLEADVRDLASGQRDAEQRAREGEGGAAMIRHFFGDLLEFHAAALEAAGGDATSETYSKSYTARLAAMVKRATEELVAGRDEAEEEWQRSEQSAFEPREGMPLVEQVALSQNAEYAKAVRPKLQNWQHYSPGLDRLARERGVKLALMVQAELQKLGKIPAGYGLVAV